MAIKTLTRELTCIICQYNLRGLSMDINCPECAHPIQGTWRAAQTGCHPDAGAILIANRIVRDWLAAAANAASLPLDGVKFVTDALEYTKSSRANRDFSVPGGASAAEICAGVRKHARTYFNSPDEAHNCLSQWRIRSSEDVGAIVFVMVETGLLRLDPGDRREDFEGLFTFDQLIGDILQQAKPG